MEYDANLIRSVAEPVILTLVAERAMYGYEIIKLVNKRTDGKFAWKEGTLYPCLHRLEGEQLIQSEWVQQNNGRTRKYYNITRKGKGVMKDKVEEWSSFVSAVQAILLTRKDA
ncbi:MAG: helix-turn-helix transcriptional regulator [Verrucomicrobiota bacterium]|jgi:DNA-binding PadR family transcriptional regulator|nr:helix-turn-helix transcriptional regulator [Verrucomicrobiota bacterium]